MRVSIHQYYGRIYVLSNVTEQPQTALDKLDGHAFAKKHPELWKLVKWMIAGQIATVPELGVYMLCLYGFRALDVTNMSIFGFMQNIVPPSETFHIAVVIYAYMISTAVGYAIAFVLNRKATFHADINLALSTFFYVLMVCGIIYFNGVSGPIISSLVGHLPIPVSLAEGVSKFLSMMAAGVLTYPITRFVIHRKKKSRQETEAA